MNIYFAGSIRGGRKDRNLYLEIIQYLKDYGDVLTEHIGDENIDSEGEDVNDQYIHDRDMDWLMSSDVMVAEVTNPSLGVGYEIGRAVENDKKIICLFRTGERQKLSAMIGGSKKLICIEYFDINDLKNKINQYFSN